MLRGVACLVFSKQWPVITVWMVWSFQMSFVDGILIAIGFNTSNYNTTIIKVLRLN